MAADKIQLNTLKECLQFLLGLHQNQNDVQTQVAAELEKRISKYYTPSFLEKNTIQSALSQFLHHASHFYTRLCKYTQPWTHKRERTEQIVDALLECTPKFLAVMYFLWYNVDPGFSKLDGGGWKQNWTGALTGSYWHMNSGGDLDQYLFAKSGDSKHGVIPGGFTSDDQVIYNTFWQGYYQGSYMTEDLKKIVDKGKYNYFRSVFVSSVIGESAKRQENAANSLVLARTFCDIVLGETEKEKGGSLITALNEGLHRQVISKERSICWQDLLQHCAKLRKKFDMLFGNKHFDFTGLSTDTGNLNKTALAQKTADWLRTNITTVRGHFVKIEEYKTGQHLGEYFTKNLFPYGFTIFNKTRFDMRESDLQTLKKDWCDVINEFKNTSGDLDKLVRILDGRFRDSCPILPPKKPEVPPAKVPEAPKEVVPEKKVPVTPPKMPEAPPVKVPEGNQDQGKKSEGAQNQGKKSEGTPPILKPTATTPSPGDHGVTGPKGSKGQQGSPDAGSTVYSSTQDTSGKQSVQTQQVTTQVQSAPPGRGGAGGGSGGAAIPGQPGVQDPGSSSADAPTIQPGSPRNTVLAQSTSVPGPGTGPTGVQGTGSPTSQGSDHTPSSGPTESVAKPPGKGGSGYAYYIEPC
ncbi:Ribosome-binding protein 1, putative [Babesia ovata]|uniref:Ribosome-binding protein 1, putative n=1 Tax=Babesia ovata TaxID=189622 RepID=A0A2H6KAR9_9APIC|nr:Ribosome-binding protein 1, putative [Babesia ovata]GBE60091.1 Ribosome-binding protein 1, putative [Babesia ovata]